VKEAWIDFTQRSWIGAEVKAGIKPVSWAWRWGLDGQWMAWIWRDLYQFNGY
jgi:hypothetical protein